MGRRSKEPPVAFVSAKGVWPHGPFTKNAPTYVQPLATLAQRLENFINEEGWSQRQVARTVDINVATVNHILAGRVIPDTATLAALETGLNIDLWDNT